MEQTIGMERLYKLGDFKNLKFIDTISGIQDEYILNDEFQDMLRVLQLVRADKYYLNYIKLFDDIIEKVINKILTTEEAINILEINEMELTKALAHILKNNLKSIVQKE